MAVSLVRDGESGRDRASAGPSDVLPLRSSEEAPYRNGGIGGIGLLMTARFEGAQGAVDFNDPAGWGFCRYCAFSVAKHTTTGIMVDHQRRIGDRTTELCYGSGTVAVEQVGTEAMPIPAPDPELLIKTTHDFNYEPMDSDPRHPRAQAAAAGAAQVPTINLPTRNREPGLGEFNDGGGGDDPDE